MRVGLLLAVFGDEAGNQRLLVAVQRIAQAHAAGPFGIGQFLVGRGDVGLVDQFGVVHDRAGPHRQAVPVAVRVAEFGRDGLVECGRFDRLEQALLGGRDEVSGVDGDVHVCFGVLALGGEPLAELAVVAGLELEFDAGLVLVLLEGGLDAVVTAAVHLQHRTALTTARRQRRASQDGDGRGGSVTGGRCHVVLQECCGG